MVFTIARLAAKPATTRSLTKAFTAKAFNRGDRKADKKIAKKKIEERALLHSDFWH